MTSIRSLILIAVALGLIIGGASPGSAEVSRNNASVCIGYNPDLHRWGWDWDSRTAPRICAEGYALYGLDRSAGRSRPGSNIPAVGSCCKLPENDILTAENVNATESCPPDYIATGGTFEDFENSDAPSELRCTKINTARYQLGAATPGVMWGVAAAASFPFVEPDRIMKRTIPLAIRFGIGRASRTVWSNSGCVGSPIGSLLTGKLGKGCGNAIFRELRYRGVEGDLPNKTPVRMIPECGDISDIFDPEAKCLP